MRKPASKVRWRRPLRFYEYEKKLNSGINVLCRVQVHLLEVSELQDSFPEKDSRRLEWVTPREAAKRVNEPELKAPDAHFRQANGAFEIACPPE